MNIHFHAPIRIAATVTLFAALTAGAAAADVPQVHVNYADLNLGTESGATVLYKRIRGAAGLVCGVPDARDLGQLTRARACAADAVAAAVAAVNAPALTSVHDVKMGEARNLRLATSR